MPQVVNNPLRQISLQGQSVWLDYIDRSLVYSGGLARLIAEDGLRGVTSNPAIFEKAVASDASYRAELEDLRGEGLSPTEILESLILPDIAAAAGHLHTIYAATGGRDGYVSLEVAPALAHDTEGTLAEARRLWAAIRRDNLMIKVPATEAGLPAVTALIADGINVNVTLLFSNEMYARVAEAYLAGLERRSAAGLPLDRVASVASFFVSRIDTEVDALLDARLASTQDAGQHESLSALKGLAAIANAKLAYQSYRKLFSGPRWRALADAGAQTQRLLWASTGVKNPAYRDVCYIEELIGPDTVNTVPPATLNAFRDHGQVRNSLGEGAEDAATVLDALNVAGISLNQVTDRLLNAGVDLFIEAYDKLLGAVAR